VHNINILLSPSIFLFAPFPLVPELAQGYPLRHENIVFYLVAALSGVDLHPSESCTQIRVGAPQGPQMNTPNQLETVLFHTHTMTTTQTSTSKRVLTRIGLYHSFSGPPVSSIVSNLASPADMTGQLSMNGSSPARENSSRAVRGEECQAHVYLRYSVHHQKLTFNS
jgi:hypothetical protein